MPDWKILKLSCIRQIGTVTLLSVPALEKCSLLFINPGFSGWVVRENINSSLYKKGMLLYRKIAVNECSSQKISKQIKDKCNQTFWAGDVHLVVPSSLTHNI